MHFFFFLFLSPWCLCAFVLHCAPTVLPECWWDYIETNLRQILLEQFCLPDMKSHPAFLVSLAGSCSEEFGSWYIPLLFFDLPGPESKSFILQLESVHSWACPQKPSKEACIVYKMPISLPIFSYKIVTVRQFLYKLSRFFRGPEKLYSLTHNPRIHCTVNLQFINFLLSQ